jgi:hypothetical protein
MATLFVFVGFMEGFLANRFDCIIHHTIQWMSVGIPAKKYAGL